MKRTLRHLLPCLLALLPFPALAAGAAGLYTGNEGHEMAAELLLREDGSYAYALSVGALDEESQGRWEERDGVITLITEPKPVPPRFTPAPAIAASGTEPPPYLLVTLPNGRGLAGIDFTITCADGTRIDGYTQVYGWDFASETCAAPQAITLREPIHAIESPPYPIAPGATALHFHLVPNDLGRVDLTGTLVVIEGEKLTLVRERGQIRFRRTKPR